MRQPEQDAQSQAALQVVPAQFDSFDGRLCELRPIQSRRRTGYTEPVAVRSIRRKPIGRCRPRPAIGPSVQSAQDVTFRCRGRERLLFPSEGAIDLLGGSGRQQRLEGECRKGQGK